MITNTTAKSVYTIATGTPYPIGFDYQYNPDGTPQIKVFIKTYPEQILEYGVDYDISANGLDVELITEQTEGETLVIIRDIPMVQLSDYGVGRIDPEQLEKDFDETVMRDQELQAEIDILSEMPEDHEARISEIESVIPEEASSSNQLTDKNYVDTLVSNHTNRTDNPHSVTAAQVGLGNCDNTSDLNKPVSTATQNALDLKANVASLATVATSGSYTDLSNKPSIPSAINDLSDVDISTEQDGDFLRYDANSGKWKNTQSSATVGFDAITGSPYDNTLLGKELTIKTNCLTSIPQDIKLELNAGTLTLKSGSKVYFADGSSYTTTSDKTRSSGASGKLMIVYRKTSNDIVDMLASECYSGTTQPTVVDYAVWFDTTYNIVKWTNNGFATWQECSFPVALTTFTGGAPTGIDQVFNGFGYIGSTVFALPGVKTLAPNGRNPDGTLLNIEIQTPNVITNTNFAQNTSLNVFLYNNNGTISWVFANNIVYNNKTNYNQTNNYVWEKTSLIGTVTLGANGVVSEFNTKTTFHAVDYNDFNALNSAFDVLKNSFDGQKIVDIQFPTSTNDYKWYIKWANQMVIQGQQINTTAANITLPVPMNDTDYYIGGISFTIANVGSQSVASRTTTGFSTGWDTKVSSTYGWFVVGKYAI